MNTFLDWSGKISLIIFLLICLNSIIGDMLFKAKYNNPKTSAITSEIIYTQNDPVQNNLDGKKYIKVYGEKNTYALNLQAEYSISGLVVTTNNNFWFRDVMRSTFDDVCLLDLGIVWGELTDKQKLYKHWKFKSKKTLGQSRRLEWRSLPPYEQNPWGLEYVSSHISHTHMIPANNNVMSALLRIKKNDIVKLDGYLVDIYTTKSELVARTSLSRYDKDSTSRGSGACEDMYVKQVQIGKRIYK